MLPNNKLKLNVAVDAVLFGADTDYSLVLFQFNYQVTVLNAEVLLAGFKHASALPVEELKTEEDRASVVPHLYLADLTPIALNMFEVVSRLSRLLTVPKTAIKATFALQVHTH